MCSASLSRIKQASALLLCLMGYSHNERGSQTQGCVNVAGISLFAFSAGQRKSTMPVVFADVTCSLDSFQTDQQSSHRRRPNAHLNVYARVRECEIVAIGFRIRLELNDIECRVCFIDILYGNSNFIHHYTSYCGEDTGRELQ